MVRKNVIICPHCKQNSGHCQEDFMYMVLTSDVTCKNCGKVVIKANKIEY